MDPDKFYEMAKPYIQQTIHRDLDLRKIAGMVQTRIEYFPDIAPLIDFFEKVPEYDPSMYRHKKMKTTEESSLTVMKEVLPVLEAQADWNRDAIFEACKTLAEQMEKKNGWLLFPLGIALSGKARTPGGGTDLAAMMGREETIVRVKAALEKL